MHTGQTQTRYVTLEQICNKFLVGPILGGHNSHLLQGYVCTQRTLEYHFPPFPCRYNVSSDRTVAAKYIDRAREAIARSSLGQAKVYVAYTLIGTYTYF